MFTPEEEAQLRALIKPRASRKCRITDDGQLYSTYERAADYFNATKWRSGRRLPKHYKDITWTIVAHGKINLEPIYFIEANDEQYLIGEGGISIIDEPVSKKRAFYTPEEGDRYVYLYGTGFISHEIHDNSMSAIEITARGLAFPDTSEGTAKAKALVALERHIVAMDAKYGEPEDRYITLDDCGFWYDTSSYIGIGVKAEYQRSGTIMHNDTTPDERAQRLKLLKDFLSPSS